VAELEGEEATPILTLQQLPESRRAILLTLKRQGTATIAGLAAELRLTGEAVRQQLLQMQRDGWIEASVDRTGTRTGRPATLYRLSHAGDHLFPKTYDELSIAILDALSSELGSDAAVRVLARVTEDRVKWLEPTLRNLTLADKVEALKNLYVADDPYMETGRANGDHLLIERNCPFYNTAMRRPALCSVSVNALSRLLGVRVAREEKFQNGDGRCVFRIFAQQPVETGDFVPE
jgi:predicted ArsR family transcriptional regulator